MKHKTVYLFDHSKRTRKGGFPVYIGYIDEQKEKTIVELSPIRSQEIINHSPDGFNWGYGGSGPAQCALGVLLDHTNDKETARELYQDFLSEVIAHMPIEKKLEMPVEKIQKWIDSKENSISTFE